MVINIERNSSPIANYIRSDRDEDTKIKILYGDFVFFFVRWNKRKDIGFFYIMF